jgi:hypothetical protein
VGGFVRFFLARHLLPHRLAGLAIDRQHLVLMHAALRQRAARGVLRVTGDPDRNSGQHINAIAIDDRRG